MKSRTLTPRLIVAGADRAIDFYQEVFGAKLLERYADETGHVVHASLELLPGRDAVVSLAEEQPGWHNHAPSSLGGTPVILGLLVEDVDSLGARLEAAGAEVIFPIADQFYGHREGRFRDPFGHLWIVTQIVEQLTPEEVHARMAGA